MLRLHRVDSRQCRRGGDAALEYSAIINIYTFLRKTISTINVKTYWKN